jgi:hypothetical protein
LPFGEWRKLAGKWGKWWEVVFWAGIIGGKLDVRKERVLVYGKSDLDESK